MLRSKSFKEILVEVNVPKENGAERTVSRPEIANDSFSRIPRGDGPTRDTILSLIVNC